MKTIIKKKSIRNISFQKAKQLYVNTNYKYNSLNSKIDNDIPVLKKKIKDFGNFPIYHNVLGKNIVSVYSFF